MQKLIENISKSKKRKKVLLFLMIGVLITPAIYKLVRPGFFSMYDDMQVLRLQQMDVCVKDGQVPCRWVPDMGLGYGYPLYQYYAPFPYYFMEATHLLGFSYINSVKAGFAFSIFFAALFFYLFTRNFFSIQASLVGAFLYTYAPFRAQDLYVRGAMGELWGAVSVPLIFYAFEKIIKEKGMKSFLLFSFSVLLFFISHNLTVLLFAPLIIVWMLIRIYMLKKERAIQIRVFISGVLGVGLAAYYLIPLIVEKNLVHIETLTSGYFGYLQHFLSIKQIFLEKVWGYGPSVLGPNDDALLGIGPVHTTIALLGFAAAAYRSKIKGGKVVIPTLLIISFLAYAFLAHERSTFIWQALRLDILQFPWRSVMVCVFIASFLAGYFIDYFSKSKRLVVVFVVIIATLGIYGSFFQPKDWFSITDGEKLSGENLKKQLTASIYDYLPKSAKRAPDNIAPDTLVVIAGDVETLTSQEGSNWFRYELQVNTNSAHVAIPAYDFPVWKVYLGSKELPTMQYGDFGLVSFEIPKGKIGVSARLTDSLSRKIGDTISLAAFVFVGVLLLGKPKKWKSFIK